MFPYDMTHMQVLQTFGERWMMDQLPISSTFALSYAIALGLAFLAILPIAAAQVRSDIVSQISKISNAISQTAASQAGGTDGVDVVGGPESERGDSDGNRDEHLVDRAPHAVSQLKGNMSSISNTLQSSRSTTSVLQQLAVILPIVLAIPQSLGMYLKCLSFPSPFTDVINKFMWIPNFDLSVSFSIPPYITLIFQFILFVVAVIFVKSLLVADWTTFARITIRFEVMLVCYTKLISQHLLSVVPSADMADEIARIIAASRVRTRVEMLEAIRMECQARSVGLTPSSLLQLSRRVPLAPTSALQPFLLSAVLLAAEEEVETGNDEAQSVGHLTSSISDDVVVRVAPTSTEET
jgi:hypothetical protein